MRKRRRILVVSGSLAGFVLTVALFLLVRPQIAYAWEMRPIHVVIAAGEQGWGDEATRLLHEVMARTTDRHALAERLLNEHDGSLVAEGMVLAVQSGHPNARTLVQQHLKDTRWDWALANNDEVARQLLAYLDEKPTEEWVRHWIAETAAH